MPRLLLRLLQVLHLPCALGAVLAAIIALLGFSFPFFDALNHFQPFLFAANLIALALVPVLYQRFHLRAFMLAATATGFMSSAIIIVPEAISGLVPYTPASAQDGRDYKLLTYNVFGRNYDMEDAAAMILNQDPDIITLQEYFQEQREPLHPLLVAHYPYYAFCDGAKRAHIAIYSRIPFTLQDGGACGSTDEGRTVRLIARMQDQDKTFTVMTTHLDWPIQISQFHQAENFIDGFYRATARKQNEYDELRDAVLNVSGPLILAGDFNSTPWSYAMRYFTRATSLDRRTRNLWTYPTLFYYLGDWRPTIPVFPLDQVMTRDGVIVHSVETARPAGSDHLPVVTTFSVASHRG